MTTEICTTDNARYYYRVGMLAGRQWYETLQRRRRRRIGTKTPGSLDVAKKTVVFARSEPIHTSALKASGFLERWPGLLGSSKWRTPDFVINQLGEAHVANIRSTDRLFLDLGCGDARVLIGVANRYPHLRCVGFELNVRVYKDALENIRLATDNDSERLNIDVYLKSAYLANIAEADVVYMYSNRRGLAQMHGLLSSKMKMGSRLVLYQTDLETGLGERAKRRRVRCKDPLRSCIAPPVFVYEFG